MRIEAQLAIAALPGVLVAAFAIVSIVRCRARYRALAAERIAIREMTTEQTRDALHRSLESLHARGKLSSFMLTLALVVASLTGCSSAQHPAPASPPQQIDPRAAIRAIATVTLPQVRMLAEQQITDPVVRSEVDAAFAPAIDAVQAATSRSLCEALPAIDRALVDLDGALARITAQPPVALTLEHVVIGVGRVGLPLSVPQCAASGAP